MKRSIGKKYQNLWSKKVIIRPENNAERDGLISLIPNLIKPNGPYKKIWSYFYYMSSREADGKTLLIILKVEPIIL